MGEGACEKSIQLFQEALRINLEVAKINQVEGSRLPHIRHLSLERALRLAKRFDDAMHHFYEARRYSIELFAPGGHFEAS
jgi:hypothetical protein